jgi:hypothetical protein
MPIIIDGGRLCAVCRYVESNHHLCRTFALLDIALCRRCCTYNRCCVALRAHPAYEIRLAEDKKALEWVDGVFN